MWQPVPYQPTAHTPLPQPLFDPSQPPPPFAHPPPDAALVARITKLAEYIARNGPQFVDLIRTKQGDNPDYAFLRGGPGSDYYHWYLHCTVFKRDPSLPSMPNHPHPTHYPMQQQPMAPRPPGVPRPPPPALGPSLPPHPALPPDIDHTCLYVLHALDGSQVCRHGVMGDVISLKGQTMTREGWHLSLAVLHHALLPIGVPSAHCCPSHFATVTPHYTLPIRCDLLCTRCHLIDLPIRSRCKPQPHGLPACAT